MVCPQRYYYQYGLGLEEGLVDTVSDSNGLLGWNSSQGKSIMSSLDRGNAAHFILKHIDVTDNLDQQRLAIEELLIRQGIPPLGSEMELLRENILSFLESDPGRILSQSGEGVVLREMPFHMRLHDQPGSFTVLIQGAVDLVYQDSEGRWNVVDYKYSSGRNIDKDRYRIQLMIYALAVMKQVKTDRVQLTISILEDDEYPLTRWQVSREEVDRFAKQVVKCAYEITGMQGNSSKEVKVLPAVNDCHRKECVYRTRCLQKAV
jgi:hypothetical protein